MPRIFSRSALFALVVLVNAGTATSALIQTSPKDDTGWEFFEKGSPDPAEKEYWFKQWDSHPSTWPANKDNETFKPYSRGLPFDLDKLKPIVDNLFGRVKKVNKTLEINGLTLSLEQQPDGAVAVLENILIKGRLGRYLQEFSSGGIGDSNIHYDLQPLNEIKQISFKDPSGRLCTTVTCVLANLYGKYERSGKHYFGYNEDAAYAFWIITVLANKVLFSAFTPMQDLYWTDSYLNLLKSRGISTARMETLREEGRKKSLQSVSQSDYVLPTGSEMIQMARLFWDIPIESLNLRTLNSIYFVNQSIASWGLPILGSYNSRMHFIEMKQAAELYTRTRIYIDPEVAYKCQNQEYKRHFTPMEWKAMAPEYFEVRASEFRSTLLHEIIHAIDEVESYDFSDENNIRLRTKVSASPLWTKISGWELVSSKFPGLDPKTPRYYQFPNGNIFPFLGVSDGWSMAGDQIIRSAADNPRKVDSYPYILTPADPVFKSQYHRQSPSEDLAESAVMYYVRGEEFKKQYPEKFSVFQKFFGVTFRQTPSRWPIERSFLNERLVRENKWEFDPCQEKVLPKRK